MDILTNKAPASPALPIASGKSLPPAEADRAILLPSEPTQSVATKEDDKQKPIEISLSDETIDAMNDILRERARELEFTVDDSSGHTIVRVIHSESGEVIRQLPPEVVLRFAEAFTKGAASLVEDFA